MEKSGNPNELLFRRKRRRWPREVWVNEVKAFADSGLSPEEYAAKRGIRVEALRRWLRVLGTGGTVANEVQAHKTTGFLPVRVVPATELPSNGNAFAVEVDLANGRRVRARVVDQTDTQRLADLLDALDGGQRC
jgi:transposase-like protein